MTNAEKAIEIIQTCYNSVLGGYLLPDFLSVKVLGLLEKPEEEYKG